MLIRHINPIQRAGAILTATLAMACTTPGSFAPRATADHPTLSLLPQMESGQGRIVLFRQARAEGPEHSLTMIDSTSTHDIRPGRFAHRDLSPGQHILDVVLAKRDYASVSARNTARGIERRVQGHRLYGKPLIVDIRSGETTYVEVSAAGVGVTAGSTMGFARRSGSRSGERFVTLTPDYHSTAEVPGLRYRVLFPSLVQADPGSAQSALTHAVPCGPECDVSPEMTELATRSWRGPRHGNSAPKSLTSPALDDASDAETARNHDSDEIVSFPAAPDLN